MNGLTALFLAGYLFFVLCMNGVSFLIAAFYHKKFNQKVPRLGFLTAMLACAVFIVCLFFKPDTLPFFIVVQTFALIIAGVATVWNSVLLYINLKQESK